jgi:hypothetical protein
MSPSLVDPCVGLCGSCVFQAENSVLTQGSHKDGTRSTQEF